MKTCFVIGPMNPGHLPKLHWLANKVVAEILKDKNFKVFTPDVQQIGKSTRHFVFILLKIVICNVSLNL